MFRKNLCDKISKIKNLRWLSSSFFRAVRRGILRFFGRCIVHGENCKTKSPILSFFKKTKIYENVSQKSLWQSFENKKSEMAIFFVFPRCSSWSDLEVTHLFTDERNRKQIAHKICQRKKSEKFKVPAKVFKRNGTERKF